MQPYQAFKLRSIAYFNAQFWASGAEALIRLSVEGVLAQGIEARLYVRSSYAHNVFSRSLPKKILTRLLNPKRFFSEFVQRVVSNKPSYVKSLPYAPLELLIEDGYRRVTGFNDTLFPSTGKWQSNPWLSKADIWHFHNLHGHYLSIPELAKVSMMRPVVVSPVDQFLSTGYCSYTYGCERFRKNCGNCPQITTPYPGISKDTTSELLAMKREAIKQSRMHLLVHTDWLADHYRSTFVQALSITRIHYGVNVQTFRPLPRALCAEQLKVTIPMRPVVGLFHSYIADPRKGILSVLEQLSHSLAAANFPVTVLVVGNNSDQALVYESPMMQVIALPFLTDEASIAAALNLCDLLVYPTRAENLSLTTLSALACGVPVLSADAGGQREAVRPGLSGELCAVDDYACFAERLIYLLRRPDLLAQMGQNARQLAVTEFDAERYVKDLHTYYQNVYADWHSRQHYNA